MFLDRLKQVFQRNQSEGLDATYHFSFCGEEQVDATGVIRNKTVAVQDGHVGKPNLRVTADSATWVGFLAKERNLLWAIITRRIRLGGSPSWLLAFGRCFPS